MTDNAERWRNVAQAAQWLAAGREVEYRNRPGQGFAFEWGPLKYSGVPEHLFTFNEYRLKPEPPKPREWTLTGQGGFFPVVCRGQLLGEFESVRVREVIE